MDRNKIPRCQRCRPKSCIEPDLRGLKGEEGGHRVEFHQGTPLWQETRSWAVHLHEKGQGPFEKEGWM